jgi:hypothetical protein
MLKGVASHGLLIILGVITSLEGRHPWGTGELEDLVLAARSALRQGRA